MIVGDVVVVDDNDYYYYHYYCFIIIITIITIIIIIIIIIFHYYIYNNYYYYHDGIILEVKQVAKWNAAIFIFKWLSCFLSVLFSLWSRRFGQRWADKTQQEHNSKTRLFP